MQQIDRPLHEGIALLLRQAHQVEEHRDGQRPAEILGEFAFTLVDDLVDQIIGQSRGFCFRA